MTEKNTQTTLESGSSPLALPFITLLGMVGGWLLYTALMPDAHTPIPPALKGMRESFVGKNARYLSFYADRSVEGRPLVLLHSINAAASAAEMRPLYDHYCGKRPVYALDLPGFGFSERGDRDYTAYLYKEAILDFLTSKVKAPADVVALSLTSEFAALAASQHPELFNSLVMISPTGFSRQADQPAPQQASQQDYSDLVYSLLNFPLWSKGIFQLLTSKPSINYYLQQNFMGELDPALADYAFLSAHQPGARFAPLTFISGRLFTPFIREDVYTMLRVPVLVLYDRDPNVTFELLNEHCVGCDNWQAQRITPTCGLPHFEKPYETVNALENFFKAVDGGFGSSHRQRGIQAGE